MDLLLLRPQAVGNGAGSGAGSGAGIGAGSSVGVGMRSSAGEGDATVWRPPYIAAFHESATARPHDLSISPSPLPPLGSAPTPTPTLGGDP